MKKIEIGSCQWCKQWHRPTKYTPGSCSTRVGAWDADDGCNLWEEIKVQLNSPRQKQFKFMEGGGHE